MAPRVPNPFSRPSAAPDNPDVLSLSDYRPAAHAAPETPLAANAAREETPAPTSSSATTAAASVPSVSPKPLPPPEMEEKKIRVSLKVTAAEHWELKKRIANSNMGVDEYLRTLLFPPTA